MDVPQATGNMAMNRRKRMSEYKERGNREKRKNEEEKIIQQKTLTLILF
jgi:hypothetical protein